MSVLINEETKVLIQGITGSQGFFHTRQMLAYGTRVVAGVTPGKGGEQVLNIPVYNTVREAVEKHEPDAAAIFVPAAKAYEAAVESVEAGIKLVVIISEHLPLQDTIKLLVLAKTRGVTIIGPNTFGIIVPSKCKIGIMPNTIYRPGPVGIVARSGTLSYEVASGLSGIGLGQSTVIGIGGDRVVGLNFVECLELFARDPLTEAIVMVGEIGGTAEEEAATYIKNKKLIKPVVAYVAGSSAPPGKRMGHAGAIIERGRGTYQSKIRALTEAGVKVATYPWEVAGLIRQLL
ncbi:succinate--CoA ligase subunit alpha [Moorella sulfitireducens (nom. illeg.)]|uniref:succinate--CoA ligase subunit alpha n=1 Tax=Neomoorella sulfitireducens TaxID=2972948 RepID=UPI0021AC4506|nr:succinate--CoA ligase subunit alpha [Moorella sulfitireducens]